MGWARVPLAVLLFICAFGNGLACVFLGFVVLVGGYSMAWLFLLLLGLLVGEMVVGVKLLRMPRADLLWMSLGLIVLNAAGGYLLSGHSIGPVKAWTDSK